MSNLPIESQHTSPNIIENAVSAQGGTIVHGEQTSTGAEPPAIQTSVSAVNVRPAMPETLIGLSDKVKACIAFLSLAIAVSSIWLSWKQMNHITQTLDLSTTEVQALSESARYYKNSSEPAYDRRDNTVLLMHFVNVKAQMKMITNQQALSSMAIGVGVALLSIGYALFLLGADGAFKLKAQNIDGSQMLLYGTAPGLLCFLLASLLIGVAATRPYGLQIGDSRKPPAPLTPTPQPSPTPVAAPTPTLTPDPLIDPQNPKAFSKSRSAKGRNQKAKENNRSAR